LRDLDSKSHPGAFFGYSGNSAVLSERARKIFNPVGKIGKKFPISR
jgi:hypothetical protein